MELSGLGPKDSRRKASRVSAQQASSDSQAYGKFHHPGYPDKHTAELPYGLQKTSTSTNSDAESPNLRRRTSRFGLASLFNRSKPEHTREKRENLGIPYERDEDAEANSTLVDQHSYTQRQGSLPGQSSAPTSSEDPSVPLQNRASRAALRSKASFKRESTAQFPPVWDPPPLFQAYPQAVRYATLRLPNIEVETIIRLNDRNVGLRQNSDSYAADSTNLKTFSRKEKKLKKSTVTDMLSKADWIDKSFVLITSGYLLQYAGDGPFDRLPEKILPLRKESAAFASDAIPGKPYVLQISQVSNDDGTLDTEVSRSILKKLGLRGELKRSTSSLLLVLDSPEDMNSWLVAVRKEIQTFGGREYKPDGFEKLENADPAHRLHQRPSQRFLVQRDPHLFSGKPCEREISASGGVKIPKEAIDCTVDDATPANAKRQSLATQRSSESRSVSNTAISVNQLYLDGLRESPRISYASAAKTVATSSGSSPEQSPVQISTESAEHCGGASQHRLPGSQNSGAVAPLYHHMQAISIQSPQLPLPYQVSYHRPPTQRTPSPAAPNFSIPTFSRRFSTTSSSTAPSAILPNTPSPVFPALHASPTPAIISEEDDLSQAGEPLTEEPHFLSKPNLRPSDRNTTRGNDGTLNALPIGSGVSDSPMTTDSDRRFSRRLSSLEYSRGVSPLRLANQSPSPHPPPTTTLPAIPDAEQPNRKFFVPSSGVPPPIANVAESAIRPPSHNTPPPQATELLPTFRQQSGIHVASSTRNSSLADPFAAQSFESVPLQQQGLSKSDPNQPRKLRRPMSMQVCNSQSGNQSPPPPPHRATQTDLGNQSLAPPLELDSPPKPIRSPPPPPSQRQQYPQIQARKSMPRLGSNGTVPRLGREPPPVPASPRSTRSRISITSPAESYFDSAAPHPFIPPIRVSERKFRGSLDGPWNPNYAAPQRTFMDLNAA